MGSKQRHWTDEERSILLKMRLAGASWYEVGDALGRTSMSCSSYLRDYCDRKGLPHFKRGKRKAPPRDETMPDYSAPCGALRDAMIEAFHKFAAANRISADDARLLLMGDKPKPIPGTEIFFKTSAMRRLVA